MSERYTKVFNLAENLYSLNSPVLISAGALLKDNINDKIVAQIKFKNISNKIIKAVRISIRSYDVVGIEQEYKIQHEYLDLAVERDEEFGQKEPVFLKENTARSFSVTVDEIIFSDNSIWLYNGEEQKSLSKLNKISELFDEEIAKQYKIEYGEQCNYKVTTDRDLWICTCGHINHEYEKQCALCKRSLEKYNNVSFEALGEKAKVRIYENEKEAKKKKQSVIVSIIVVLSFAILVAAFTSYSKKNTMYNEALMLVETNDLSEAIDVFTELKSFKDSKEKLKETKYSYGLKLMDYGNYTDARELFSSLGNYNDSQDKACVAGAKMILNQSSEYQKYDNYTCLRDYRKDMLQKFEEAKLVVQNYIDLKSDGQISDEINDIYNQITVALDYYGCWKVVSGKTTVAFEYESKVKIETINFAVDFYSDVGVAVYTLPDQINSDRVYYGCLYTLTGDEKEPLETKKDNGNICKIGAIKNNKITIKEYKNGKVINKLTLERY